MEASSSVKPSQSQLKPEHRIFLSHSGDEKSFVEQLWEDLDRVNQPAFFDQDRNSLPIGENFVSLIFKAAEQCSLAVVVLSEGYLSSKWPMLELSAFLKARKTTNRNLKLFPLFYKLSPSDLDAQKVETEWVEIWNELVKDGRVRAEEVSNWREAVGFLRAAKNEETEKEKALKEQLIQGEVEGEDFSKLLSEVVRELRPFNGMDFRKYGGSEPKYRRAVVGEICRCVPPMMEYDTKRIRGYHRLCKMISSMFEEVSRKERRCSTGKDGPLYLGLHGMGGVGKSTLCEAMCSYFQQEFHGRVCHVELQTDSSEGQVERVKRAIQQLAGFDNKVLEIINTFSQGIASLKKRLRELPAVFLAVDNVGDSQSSRDEAQAYLNAGLACGSKVLVTSRSGMILKSILQEAMYCKTVPRLEEIEASEVFLSVAAPGKSLSSLQPGEQEIVRACLRECRFQDDGYPTREYHPLVLRALGAYFHDVDEDHNIMHWGAALGELEKMLRMSRESKHVNDILGLNYKTLDDLGKKIFLDVACLSMMFGGVYQFSLPVYKWQISLFARFRGISEYEAGMKVKELQRKSLVKESSIELSMHDLYHEFATSLINEEGSKESGWWMRCPKELDRIFWELKRICGDEIRKLEDQKRKLEDEKRKLEDEKRKSEDQVQIILEDVIRKLEDEKRKSEDQVQILFEDVIRKLEDEKRKSEDQVQILLEGEIRKLEDENRKLEDENRKWKTIIEN